VFDTACRRLLSALVFPLILIGAGRSSAQAPLAVSKAYLDSGSVHILYTDGEQIQPIAEKEQASCESLKVAEDNQTVGWLVDFENPGTSYPVPLDLVVFRNKKAIQRFGGDLAPIEDWRFVERGKQVAFVTNALHGGGRAHYELHDAGKGTLLAKWDGPLTGESPAWTRGLWDEDAN
jgi:hypothetical protein